jgi:hypothetical protein
LLLHAVWQNLRESYNNLVFVCLHHLFLLSSAVYSEYDSKKKSFFLIIVMLPCVLDRTVSSPRDNKMFLRAGNSTARDMSLLVGMPIYNQEQQALICSSVLNQSIKLDCEVTLLCSSLFLKGCLSK